MFWKTVTRLFPEQASTLLYACTLAMCLWGSIPAAVAQFSYRDVEVLYDSAWTYRNLQLIPIRFKAGRGGPATLRLIGLQEAMQRKKATVKELPARQGTDKGSIMITNRSRETIIIKSGELLGGGKQDRAVAETALIGPGEKKEIVTVFCIEKDRWDDKPKPFFHGGSTDLELRQIMDTKKSQAAVWKDIEHRYSMASQTSKTWSYLSLYSDSARRENYARFFRQKMEESKGGFAGFLFVTGNTIMAVELFSQAEYTRASFNAMVAVYINSMGNDPDPPLVTDERKKIFLDNVLASRESQGRLIRKQGTSHRHDGQLIHIVVYGTGF